MEEKQKILEALAAQTHAFETQVQASKSIADCLLENNQLLLMMSEELRADRQIDHHRLENAVRSLESAAKTIDAVAKMLEKVQKLAYDTYVTVEARDTQLVEVLQKNAAVAGEGVENAKETRRKLEGMTAQFETFKAHTLAKADEAGKSPSDKMQPYWLLFKAWSNTPLSTRVLSTIILALLVAAFIAYVVEKGK